MHKAKKTNVPLQNKSSAQNFSEGQIKLMLVAILSLTPLIGMRIDLIAPSLPAISHELNSSKNLSKNLITFYLFGYLLGNFLIGFLSDSMSTQTNFIRFYHFYNCKFISGSFQSPFAFINRAFFTRINHCCICCQ